MLLVCARIVGPPSAAAATYYVAPQGDDSNVGSAARPFRTFAKSLTVLRPADALLIQPGTYTEMLLDIPSGTSWSNPVVVKAADSTHRPVLRPSSVGQVLYFGRSGRPAQYIVIDGLVLDAANVYYDGIRVDYFSHHIRIANTEIKNAPQQGILGGDYLELLNLDVHDNGLSAPRFLHGIYLTGSHNVIDGCDVYRNGGHGIHIYQGATGTYPETPPFNGSPLSADDNVVRNSRVHDNGVRGDLGTGIGMYTGSGGRIYNNLVWGNQIGISVGDGVLPRAASVVVANNTVFGNAAAIDGAGIEIAKAVAATVVNNIVQHNVRGLLNLPADTIVTHNCFFDNFNRDLTGATTTTNSNLFVDPRMVDPAAHDFHLTLESPCIDAGIAVEGIATDFDGLPRPLGQGVDVGAFECACKLRFRPLQARPMGSTR